jgi:hypothetical protein
MPNKCQSSNIKTKKQTGFFGFLFFELILNFELGTLALLFNP